MLWKVEEESHTDLTDLTDKREWGLNTKFSNDTNEADVKSAGLVDKGVEC